MTNASEASLLLGRLRVVAALGETRLAAVYRVVDQTDGSTALLHLTRRGTAGHALAVQQFEAIYPVGDRHPVLLQITERGTLSGRHYALSEDPAGRRIGALLPLPPFYALHYLRQLTRALLSCGPNHPPITSRNLLLVHEGQIKLLDTWLDPPDSVLQDLAPYRAPELLHGAALTQAATVYALGVLFFELLTGRRPPPAPLPRPLLRDLRPQLVLPAFEQVISRATHLSAAARFADLGGLLQALDQLAARAAQPTQRLDLPMIPVADADSAVTDHPAKQPSRPVAGSPASTGAAPLPRAMDWRSGDQRAQRRSALILIGLLVLVVSCSFALAGQLAQQFERSATWPGSRAGPVVHSGSSATTQTPGNYFIVNHAEGLNLRRLPDSAGAETVIAVVPNGGVVQLLDGPLIVGATTWVYVRAEIAGDRRDGWMVLNYLKAQP